MSDNTKRKKFLVPHRGTLEIEGPLSYGEGWRAKNTIRFRNDFLAEMPQLYNRRRNFGYKVIIYRSYKDLQKWILELEKKGEAIPMLFWLFEEEEDKQL